VPEEVLVDNQKTAVVEHKSGNKPRFSERFLDLAAHYAFTPRAFRPHRARTKGKDERMVGYIKNNFFQALPVLREVGSPEPTGRAVVG